MPDETEKLKAEIADLKAAFQEEREALWKAINSLRVDPPLDVLRLDTVMRQRYGVRHQLVSR